MLDFQALTAATQSTAGQGLSGKDVPVFLWGFCVLFVNVWFFHWSDSDLVILLAFGSADHRG